MSCIQQEPLRGLSQGKTATNNELFQQVEDKISKTFSLKLSKEEKMYKSKASEEDMSKDDQVDNSQEGKEEEEDSISIIASIEEIVKKAKYMPIKFESIEVPKQIHVNRDLVNTLKDLLQHTPELSHWWMQM